MFKTLGISLLFAVFAVRGIVGGVIGELPEDIDSRDNDVEAFAAKKCKLQHACHNGRHYFFETSTLRTRDDSAKYCEAINMVLLSIDNCTEDTFLTNLLKSEPNCGTKNFWISAQQNGNKIWRWDTGNELTYTNWKLNAPSYKNDAFCAYYHSGYLQWSDAICSKKYYHICESNNPCV